MHLRHFFSGSVHEPDADLRFSHAAVRQNVVVVVADILAGKKPAETPSPSRRLPETNTKSRPGAPSGVQSGRQGIGEHAAVGGHSESKGRVADHHQQRVLNNFCLLKTRSHTVLEEPWVPDVAASASLDSAWYAGMLDEVFDAVRTAPAYRWSIVAATDRSVGITFNGLHLLYCSAPLRESMVLESLDEMCTSRQMLSTKLVLTLLNGSLLLRLTLCERAEQHAGLYQDLYETALDLCQGRALASMGMLNDFIVTMVLQRTKTSRAGSPHTAR